MLKLIPALIALVAALNSYVAQAPALILGARDTQTIQVDISDWTQRQKNHLQAITLLLLDQKRVQQRTIKISGLDTRTATITVENPKVDFTLTKSELEQEFIVKISAIDAKTAEIDAAIRDAQRQKLHPR